MTELEPRYHPPVDALLTIGRPDDKKGRTWLDYAALYGLTVDDIPELSRLALDEFYDTLEDEKRPELFASVHALRVLGQLKAAAAIPALIELVERDSDNDWIWDDLPYSFALIGPAAIPALGRSLNDLREELNGLTVVASLKEIALAHPEARDEVIQILIEVLSDAETNDDGVNATIIYALTKLKATEALPVIEQAFAADAVDLMYMGDWDDVQVEFGLKEPDPNKDRSGFVPPQLRELMDLLDRPLLAAPVPRSRQLSGDDELLSGVSPKELRAEKAKKKAKRKQNKKMKQQNRKRK